MNTDCCHRIQPDLVRRPANALNIEIGTPMARCILKKPENWEGKTHPAYTATRWLGSGGSPLIFGVCSANCPMEREMLGDSVNHPAINGGAWSRKTTS